MDLIWVLGRGRTRRRRGELSTVPNFFSSGRPCGNDILIKNNKRILEDPSLDAIYNYCQKDDDYACIILNDISVSGSEYQSLHNHVEAETAKSFRSRSI